MRSTTCLLIIPILLCTSCGASECPLELDPPVAVVQHGNSVSVNCTATAGADGIGWEASEGSTGLVQGVKSVIWKVKNLSDWETRPRCFRNFKLEQCDRPLNVVLYQYPDEVSVSVLNHEEEPLREWSEYELMCTIRNVAPIGLLTLRWYKDDMEVQNVTFNDTRKTPVIKLSTLPITPQPSDDGVAFHCEAVLELGAHGPQPPVSVRSKPYNIIVFYSPNVFMEQIHKMVVGGNVVFNCSSTGNPLPQIEWKYWPADNVQIHTSVSGHTRVSVLTISAVTADQKGTITCTASNLLGSSSQSTPVAVKTRSSSNGIVAGILTGVILLGVLIGVGVVIYRMRR
ncbi:hypothetical protein GJAV_G00058400 [Gymnothorax javanicus]|nr:hypothetical protein GJAV_G00058400 [Gymnothorax javanicus]